MRSFNDLGQLLVVMLADRRRGLVVGECFGGGSIAEAGMSLTRTSLPVPGTSIPCGPDCPEGCQEVRRNVPTSSLTISRGSRQHRYMAR